MNPGRRPPALAIWLLLRFLRGRRREALIGDLGEEYRHGRSPTWYWRQALLAIVADLREQPPRWFRLGTLRLLLVACVIVGASLDAKWPFFLLALDPSWLLLLRWHRRRRRSPREPEPCAP